jgi:hypothetical protein
MSDVYLRSLFLAWVSWVTDRSGYGSVTEENFRERDFAASHLDEPIAFQAREIRLKRSAGRCHSHAISKVGAVHAAGCAARRLFDILPFPAVLPDPIREY